VHKEHLRLSNLGRLSLNWVLGGQSEFFCREPHPNKNFLSSPNPIPRTTPPKKPFYLALTRSGGGAASVFVVID
jgi:hypothetical protein